MSEPTLEQLYAKLDTVTSKVDTFIAQHEHDEHKEHDKHMAKHKGETEHHDRENGEHEHRHEKHPSGDHPREARKEKEEAMRKAMEEPDDEKRHEKLKEAAHEYMEQDHHKEAMGPRGEHGRGTRGREDEHEKKEEREAQIASIIAEKKAGLVNQILTANRMINPAGLKDVEKRMKYASISEVEHEFNIIKPFIGGVIPQQQTEKFVPFYASMTPQDIDKSQLSASSPDSDFAQISTKELLKEVRG